MKKTAHIIRIITTAPIMAFCLFTLIFLFDRGDLSDTAHYVFSLVFYSVFPLLAYPTVRIVPTLRKKGRAAERTLAIIFSVIGYIAALFYFSVCGATAVEWMAAITYLISGVVIALSSSILKFNASGHACGVSGPIALLTFALGLEWLAAYVLLLAVFWASLKMGRHKPSELVVGSIIPIVIILVLSLIF